MSAQPPPPDKHPEVPPPGVVEPSEESKRSAVELLERSRGRNRPPPPAGATCFLLDGQRIAASAELVSALENVGRLVLREAAAADTPENRQAWAWLRIRLGGIDLIDFLTVRSGGAKDAPGDGLPSVAVVGA